MAWFVYIVRCSDRSFYVGITKDVEKRLAAHNNGTASRYTRSRLPARIEFFEKHRDLSNARKREIQIKNWNHQKKQMLVSLNKKI